MRLPHRHELTHKLHCILNRCIHEDEQKIRTLRNIYSLCTVTEFRSKVSSKIHTSIYVSLFRRNHLLLEKILSKVWAKEVRLKVSKSQKHFFLKLPTQRTNILQNSALASHLEFCLIFRSVFWTMEFQEKLLLRSTYLQHQTTRAVLL